MSGVGFAFKLRREREKEGEGIEGERREGVIVGSVRKRRRVQRTKDKCTGKEEKGERRGDEQTQPR